MVSAVISAIQPYLFVLTCGLFTRESGMREIVLCWAVLILTLSTVACGSSNPASDTAISDSRNDSSDTRKDGNDDSLAATDGGTVDTVEDTGDTTEDTGDAAQDTGDAAQDTGDAAQDTGDAAQDTGDAAQDTGDATQDTGDAAEDTVDAAEDTVDVAEDTEDVAEDTVDAGPVPPRREGLFPSYRFVNAQGDRATTKFTNYVYPHAKHNLGDQARPTLAPGHSVDATYQADGVSWYLPADVSFSGGHWPLEPRNDLFHLRKGSAHMDSAFSAEIGYALEEPDERSYTFAKADLAGLAPVFRYVDGSNNHTLTSPIAFTKTPPPGGMQPAWVPDGPALGYGYPRYGKVDATQIESLLVTTTHQIGSSGRFVSLSSNPIGGGAVWDIIYTDAAGEATGFVNHLDFGRGVQTTLVYLFDEDDEYNNFERSWLATEGGGQMWASVGHFDMDLKEGCSGTNTTQECFDNVFGSPCLQIENVGLTQVSQAIPLEYFPWMHEFTPPTEPKRIRAGHWPTYPVDGKTYMSKVPNGGGAGESQEPIAYGVDPPYAATWNASVLVQPPKVTPETPRGLIIYPDDRIGKTVDFSLFAQGRPVIQYTVRVTTTAKDIPATVSIPALFLKGSLRHWVEFYDPADATNTQVVSSPQDLATGRFEARQPSFGGNPDVKSTHMSYILSEDVTPTSPAIAFYAVGEEAGGPLQSVAVAFKSDSDPGANPPIIRDDPFNSKHVHVQPVASHITYASGTIQNGGSLKPGTYEWTTFIIVDELQHIKGHIDWLHKTGITGGGYQYTP
jgi:hypothetical protein